EVVARAKEQKVATMAVTDHDSIAEVKEAIKEGKRQGVEVLSGTEVFCKCRDQFIHMLGYGFDVDAEPIVALLEKVREDRGRWVKAQIKKLQEENISVKEEKVYEFCGDTPPLFSSIAYGMWEEEKNRNHPALKDFNRYDNPLHEISVRLLAYGKPFFTPHYIPEGKEFIDAIHRSGGAAVLAHPGYDQMRIDFTGEKKVIFELLKNQIDGVEVYYSTHTKEETQIYYDFCKKYGLLYTAGSDFHGKYKPSIEIGQTETTDPSIVKNLKERIVWWGEKKQ
ncbi:MAG TPA: hypothetical protein DHN33_02590, partial [Eubacteriaceae bacterium]|nr:hypothetical protein [Eubacteriaceae bacterium]